MLILCVKGGGGGVNIDFVNLNYNSQDLSCSLMQWKIATFVISSLMLLFIRLASYVKLGTEQSKSTWFRLFDFLQSAFSNVENNLKRLLSDRKVVAWRNFYWCHRCTCHKVNEKSHGFQLIYFSPLCIFTCFLKALAYEDAKLHWSHLFNFSPLCAFKWILKSPAREDA